MNLQEAEKYTQRRHRRRHWHSVLACLAAVVVFCTTYALILPAITMNWACGLEAHTHGEACFDEQGALICGLTEHSHTDDCRMASRELSYEDAELRITVTVESDEPLPEELSLAVETPEPALLLSGEEEQQEGQWFLRQLALLSGGEVLSGENYRMTARVQVKPEALAALMAELETAEAAPEAEMGIELGLYQLDDELGLRQMTEQLVAADETAEPMEFAVQDGLLALRASGTPNPSYTVQYYAYIPRFATTGDQALTVYDTSGKKLPQNNKEDNPTKSIYLKGTNNFTDKDQNNGDQTQIYTVNTTLELTQIYTDEAYEYIKAPNTLYVNKLTKNDCYTIQKVWVLKEGKEATSIDEADWDTYDAANIHFTNREAVADKEKNIIYIADETVIRLVYGTTNGSISPSANFYDYDISSGKSGSYYLTGAAGINSQGNYTANSKTTWAAGRDLLAFGNSNTKTGLGNYKFAGLYLNQYSKKDSTKTAYQLNYGCIFGLADRLDENGHIVYNEWLLVPKLFNEDGGKNVTGKYCYENSELTFTRVGDTYTLSSAQVKDAAGATISNVSNLQNFFNPSPSAGKIHTRIFTNNFWPMDTVPENNHKDPLFGKSGVTMTAKGYKNEDSAKPGNWAEGTEALPVSDDGRAHNSYFGLQYAVNFELTADYVGPLEYYFFGDDDMWVFLDGKLVCDIGGVHSTVGEYVNLWDYLNDYTEEERVGTHTLTFFYTERGASGSTCYMNFTLPSVSGVNLEQKTGELKVSKEIQSETDVVGDPTFDFDIFFADANGNRVLDDYAYTYHKKDGTTEDGLVLHEGTQFTMKAGEYIIVHNLPVGLQYTVCELADSAAGYAVEINGTIEENRTADGTIQADENVAAFVNVRQHNTLTLIKEVQGIETTQKFTFEISYTLNGEEKTDSVELGHNGEHTLTLPVGTVITIREPSHDGFSLGFTAMGSTPKINADGSCTVTLTENTVITAVNTAGFELPKTGGPGTWLYTLGGTLLLAAGALFLYKQRRKGGAASS